MGADLTSVGFFDRSAIVIMDDYLAVLDYDRNKDRLKKVLYDRIENIVVWKKIPWGRMVTIGILIGPFSIPLFLESDMYGKLIGSAVLLMLAFLQIRYFYYRKSFIRIYRAGEMKEFSVIVSPGKLHRKIQTICNNIERTQSELRHKAEAEDAQRRQDQVAAVESSLEPSSLSDMEDDGDDGVIPAYGSAAE